MCYIIILIDRWLLMVTKIFYKENNELHIATGNILKEDDCFVTIDDRFDGIIRLGKNYIVKIKDVIDDDRNNVSSRL